ncbi:MAG: carbohydrate kinase family protein [Candidatus Acidiferrales bacterium]
MPATDVCVVGEINPDLILYGLPKELKPEQEILIDGFRLTLGSSSAIFAHNLSALGTRVGMISKIGGDPLGKMALDWLSASGVDLSHVSQANRTPTGLTVILSHPGERFIFTYPGTMFELSYEDLDLDYIFSSRHLHLSSFFLHRALRPRVSELFRQAKSKGLTTSLDTNDDPENHWGEDLLEVLRFVDICFPNEREAKMIARTADLSQAVEKLARLCPTVVVKLGPEGALLRVGKKQWRSPALQVTPIDAVGAGDSFDAGYIHRFLEGAAPEDCLAYANVAGAFSTTRKGGTEAFRDRESMKQFFRDHLRQK